MEFPLSEILNKFLKLLNDVAHVREFGWIVLNHVVNEWSHKFKSFQVYPWIWVKDGMALRERERMTVKK